MKRLVLLLVGGVLLTGGFYVVWPAWTLHRIAEAIRADDSATLERKIDFPSIRASARAPLIEEVTRRYDQFQGSGGNLLGVFGPQMKKEVLPSLVDSALEAIATPANVLYFARNRVALKDALRRAMEQRIVVGNTRWGGTQMPPAAGTAGQPSLSAGTVTRGEDGPRYASPNIKRIALVGPLTYEIGFHRDARAAEAELLLRLAFTGTDWRVVELMPRL